MEGDSRHFPGKWATFHVCWCFVVVALQPGRLQKLSLKVKLSAELLTDRFLRHICNAGIFYSTEFNKWSDVGNSLPAIGFQLLFLLTAVVKADDLRWLLLTSCQLWPVWSFTSDLWSTRSFKRETLCSLPKGCFLVFKPSAGSDPQIKLAYLVPATIIAAFSSFWCTMRTLKLAAHSSQNPLRQEASRHFRLISIGVYLRAIRLYAELHSSD